MDLQAIGIIAVTQTRNKKFSPADEERFYQEMAGAWRIGKVVELVSSGFNVLISAYSYISFRRLIKFNRWTSASE